ncbi:GNAT family N-acetyltransferase [Salipiger sp. P9]|uniref:GNAT family N-acetyltransferase n=1 Tax=Salipiger pentaromativorans TaxID=2943193 RepID=UPI002157E887|nr:GNAT family N-acetyltransferase [Salipiger pentaromativorans]MCR8550843.1 GNAT family N-acetyltransferase [Salipiger pentaromativorans]
MSAAVEQHRPGPGARQAARLGGRIPALDTRRLQLRGPRIYDFGAYAAILCSDRAEYMGGPLSRTEAWSDFTQYTALWLLHGHGLWTIDAQTTPSAGFVILGYEYDDPEAELGILMTAEAEGHGYAQEACEAARDYAFDTLNWDSVVSYVDAENTRARHLMERLGAARDTQAEDDLGDGTQVWRHRREARLS